MDAVCLSTNINTITVSDCTSFAMLSSPKHPSMLSLSSDSHSQGSLKVQQSTLLCATKVCLSMCSRLQIKLQMVLVTHITPQAHADDASPYRL